MYDSYHFVGFEKLARLRHWMSSLGIEGIGEGVKRFLLHMRIGLICLTIPMIQIVACLDAMG